MKKLKVFSISLCLLITCMFLFSGCTSLYVNRMNLTKYEQQVVANDILEINTEGLTGQEKKTAIAEAYINISFTVIISQETKTEVFNKSGALVSTDTSNSFSSFGSGVIVRSGGYILTNYHVIQNVLSDPTKRSTTNNFTGETTTTTTTYKVHVSQDGGETNYEATVLWSVINFDLAIIFCEDFASLPAAPMKDRSVYCAEADRIKVLEEIITVGTQYDEENYNSATTGTISSAVNRTIWGADLSLNYEYLIQHNASINHGNSGGALVDMDGNLIGVNTLGIDSANLLFYSVSIYPVIEVIDTVVENWEQNGKSTTEVSFGLSVLDKHLVKNANKMVKEEYKNFNKDGVIVTEVTNDCIISGIKKDDIVVEISFSGLNTNEVFKINNTYDFLYARIQLHTFNSATVKVLRNNEEIILNLIKG